MRAASSALGLGVCFLALACAGSKRNTAVGSTIMDDAGGIREESADAAPADAALSDADGGASADGAAPDSATPAVDPAVARALLAKSGEGASLAQLGLRFEVMELGSELPWAFAVVNRGTEAVLVDFDARLLSLEIQLPPASDVDAKGKAKKPPAKAPKPVLCRLPADVLPNSVDPALAQKLEPGEGLVQHFDPRLYCVGKTPWPLVEGAEVHAHFGWPVKLKVSYRSGKREETPAVQKEPFVAEPSDTQGSLPASDTAETSERRVKELLGTPFTLGSNFADTEPASSADASPGLELRISGSDAADESSATATTTIKNRGKRKQDLYFRREFVTYEVGGPDGVFECDPKPDLRAPADRSAMLTLRPGGSFSAVSRLIEMCPAHAFARPGLYLVHARFDAADPGADLGFKGFMGRLVSRKPALVRVHHGELAFTPANGVMRVHVGQ